MERDLVEYEELSFRSEVSYIADAGGFQMALGALGHGSRVEPVTFFGDRIEDAGDQAKRRRFHKRIDPVTRGVWDQQHVRLVYRRPAAQAGTVKPDAAFKHIGAKLFDWYREVMPLAEQVCEPYINKLDRILSRELQCRFCAHSSSTPLNS